MGNFRLLKIPKMLYILAYIILYLSKNKIYFIYVTQNDQLPATYNETGVSLLVRPFAWNFKLRVEFTNCYFMKVKA